MKESEIEKNLIELLDVVYWRDILDYFDLGIQSRLADLPKISEVRDEEEAYEKLITGYAQVETKEDAAKYLLKFFLKKQK